MADRHVFITGGAGGLGGRTARFLAVKGWRVFAGDLPGPALEEIGNQARIDAIPLDVTDSNDVQAAAETVRRKAGGLDGVVNFAGILAIGSMAEIPEEEFSRILDVNLMGTYRTNRAMLPLLLERKGRVVNISSETGWQAVAPFNGPYAITKHAVEAYSDALRRELMFLGVDVVKIQPGPFKTDMVRGIEAAFDRAVENSKYFGEMLGKLKALAIGEQDKAHDPQLVAEVVYEALTTHKPKAAYSVRPASSRVFMSYLPARWADTLLRRFLAKAGGFAN